MRGALVGLLVAAAFVLSGCQYLLGGMMGMPPTVFPDGSFDPGEFGSFDPNDPMFSMAPPLATFKTGAATVEMAGTTTTLDQLTGAAAAYDFGTEVGWTDGNGLYVRFYGEPGSMFGGGFLTVDKVTGTQHWTTADPSACKVTITKSDKTGVDGTASCKGLRWIDAMSSSGGSVQGYIEGEPAFDAEITFQAAP